MVPNEADKQTCRIQNASVGRESNTNLVKALNGIDSADICKELKLTQTIYCGTLNERKLIL